ncbi:hypothetical protein NIES2104_65970 [Leptolyngbya sp. NIES-2104]|nr:hypothetical protein NIES2104_65970 [Leptolyngbya sp. NIES-2104]
MDAPSETLSTEDIAQVQNEAVTPVPEVALPVVDPGITEEPGAEKSARIAKKSAAKSRSTEPFAEETTPVANRLVKEKEQVAELTVAEESVAENQIHTAGKATNLQTIEPVTEEAAPVTKKAAKEKEQASGKAVKMKRLTLDIPKPLHKAIKAQAVEEGISIVDMLRTLLEHHYGK